MITETNRRVVLKSMGVSLALPLMESLLPRNVMAALQEAAAQRMAIVTVPLAWLLISFIQPKPAPTTWASS